MSLRPSPALVVAAIALAFVATPPAYAAYTTLANNSVGSAQIKAPEVGLKLDQVGLTAFRQSTSRQE